MTRISTLRYLCGIFVALTILPRFTSAASLASNGRRRHSKSLRNFPLKPSNIIMVPLDINETPNPDHDPDVDSLDEIELLTILGEKFDRKFMSVSEPRRDMRLNPNGTLEYKFRKNQTPKGQEMPAELEALSQKTIELSGDGMTLDVKFSRKTRQKLQKFLWAYSYCPVRYKWKELSVRFWPRWIKTGGCENQRSCSMPAGMTCQPSKMMNITLLRYYCIQGSCHWIQIQYPILKECNCGCQPNTYNDSGT